MEKARKGSLTRRARRKGTPARPEPAARPAEHPRPAPPPLALPPDPGSAAGPRWWAALPPNLPLAVLAVNHGYRELGLAIVVVARRLGDSVLAGHFVVDLLARGVIEVDGEALSPDELPAYLDELDRRMPLHSIDPQTALAIVAEGLRVGSRHGHAPAEGLAFWQALLEPAPPAPERVWGRHPRPYAVDDALSGDRPEPEMGWNSDLREVRCVVLDAPRREH